MIIAILLAVLVGGIVLGFWLEDKNPFTMWSLVSIFCIIALALFLVFWPVAYYGYVSNIQEYHATKASVEVSRGEEMSELERAALVHKIIEVNRWLARAQYWNQTVFDPFIPDEVMALEPIK